MSLKKKKTKKERETGDSQTSRPRAATRDCPPPRGVRGPDEALRTRRGLAVGSRVTVRHAIQPPRLALVLLARVSGPRPLLRRPPSALLLFSNPGVRPRALHPVPRSWGSGRASAPHTPAPRRHVAFSAQPVAGRGPVGVTPGAAAPRPRTRARARRNRRCWAWPGGTRTAATPRAPIRGCRAAARAPCRSAQRPRTCRGDRQRPPDSDPGCCSSEAPRDGAGSGSARLQRPSPGRAGSVGPHGSETGSVFSLSCRRLVGMAVTAAKSKTGWGVRSPEIQAPHDPGRLPRAARAHARSCARFSPRQGRSR